MPPLRPSPFLLFASSWPSRILPRIARAVASNAADRGGRAGGQAAQDDQSTIVLLEDPPSEDAPWTFAPVLADVSRNSSDSRAAKASPSAVVTRVDEGAAGAGVAAASEDDSVSSDVAGGAGARSALLPMRMMDTSGSECARMSASQLGTSDRSKGVERTAVSRCSAGCRSRAQQEPIRPGARTLLERLSPGDVVDEERAGRPTVVAPCDGAKAR
jgi:hypothetical protein